MLLSTTQECLLLSLAIKEDSAIKEESTSRDRRHKR